MKSPLTTNPLRNPGEAIDEKLCSLNVKMWLVGIATLAFIVLVMLAWVKGWNPAPIPQIAVYAAAILIALCMSATGVNIYVKILDYSLGKEGEKAVAEVLNRELFRVGYEVFNDIPAAGKTGQKFNLDHVVIGKNGVYVIETKTRRKSDDDGKIVFDGKGVTIASSARRVKEIRQARNNARWLSEFFTAAGVKPGWITPIVVFPGWRIEETGNARNVKVHVCNSEMLPEFIRGGKARLSDTDMKSCADLLARHCRAN